MWLPSKADGSGQFHIVCPMEKYIKISKNTTEIRNIKKYLLAVLFNAPSTINGYYTALVAHDMNTGSWGTPQNR